jgi:hypothetical protein
MFSIFYFFFVNRRLFFIKICVHSLTLNFENFQYQRIVMKVKSLYCTRRSRYFRASNYFAIVLLIKFMFVSVYISISLNFVFKTIKFYTREAKIYKNKSKINLKYNKKVEYYMTLAFKYFQIKLNNKMEIFKRRFYLTYSTFMEGESFDRNCIVQYV